MKKALLLSLTSLMSASAFADAGGMSDHSYYALAAGLAIGAAALGGAFGQGKIGAAAMEGIARNPQSQKTMFTSMIISLALIESLVIYALVIAFMLVSKP